ncbi:MAG: VIT and vWA domain-containing protein [Candidatus Bipolaricaulia bacterium]
MRKFYRAALLAITGLLVGSWVVGAQPIIEPPWIPRPTPSPDTVMLKDYRVKIEIDNQVAQLALELTFYNPSDFVQEETYIFPVPKGTVISNLTLCGDGKCHEGKLMSATEARGIYEEIVRRTKDPALLEYLGERAFHVRVFPIPPKGEQKVKISYQQVLQRAGNLIELLYPITAQKPIEQLLIQVHLRENEPIASIYSPTHKISVQKIGESEATVSFEATQVKSAQDFRLFYTVSEKELGVDVITYRVGDEDGYFLLLISPAQGEVTPLPKDIVFVIDVSGSMGGEKIQQAKQSLKYALGKLTPQDRVAIVAFSDTVTEFSSQLLSGDGLDRSQLEAFVDKLEAGGGTNINDALLRGLSFFVPNERLKMLVFLTDGLPTTGETDVNQIIENVTAKNAQLNARIFCFGVGYDVNTILLDTLSQHNGGFSTYVEPGESIETEIAQFYEKVGVPLLTDLQISFGDLKVYDLYPPKLPDLFKGSQIQIVGRYRAPGKGTVTLAGKRQGTDWSSTFEIELPQENTQYSFLPRMWAARKIGYLLDEIRLKGENPELVDAVKKLAEKFGIVTPYTSYFAAPPESLTLSPAPCPICDRSAYWAPSGQDAVRMSQGLQALREDARELAQSLIRSVRGVSFQLDQDNIWKAAGYQQQPTLKVQFGSDAYFALASNSALREYLALGSAVLFPVGDQWVEISQSEGATQLSQLPQSLVEAITTEPVTQPQPSSQPAPERSEGSNAGLVAAIVGVLLVIGAGLAFWMWRR